MRSNNLFLGRREIARILLDNLTPAKIFIINNFIAEKTDNALSIDLEGNTIYHKDSPYEVEVSVGKVSIYQIVLVPEEHRSVGIRLTPVK